MKKFLSFARNESEPSVDLERALISLKIAACAKDSMQEKKIFEFGGLA